MMPVRKWCDVCQGERAEYKTEYTDSTSSNMGSLRVEVWVQDVCLDCYKDKVSNLDKVDSLRTRSLIGNAWTTHKCR